MNNMNIAVALISAGIPAVVTVITHIINVCSSKRLRLLALKSLIINTELPLQERMEAHGEYKRLGGNDWMDVYYQERILPLIKGDIERLK